MSNKVCQIKPCANASQALRNIADQMDRGEVDIDNVTIVAGSEVFQCGDFDDIRAVENAVWNLTFGIHKLMQPAINCNREID